MDVPRKFSEAPHLRSSIPHPKTDFGKNIYICIPMNNPVAQVYQNVIFRNKIVIPTILGKRSPSFRNYFCGNVLFNTSIVDPVFGVFIARKHPWKEGGENGK